MATFVKWYGKQIEKKVAVGLLLRTTQAAILVEKEVKRSMQEPKHGRTYKIYGKGKGTVVGGKVKRQVRRMHKASAPGEAPAVLTGDLIKSITHERAKKTLRGIVAKVGSNLKTMLWLELGTRNIAPRPALRLSLSNKGVRRSIIKLFKRPII